MWVASFSTSSSCPLELGLSRATSLDNPSVQPQGLRECSSARAGELQPGHLGQHTHTQLRKHMQAHARTCTHVHARRWGAQHAQAGHFSEHTSQAAIFKSVLHMGNHCQAQPLCDRHAENVRTNSQGPPSVSECPVYPRQADWTAPGQNNGSPKVSSATSSLKHSVTIWTKRRTKSGCRPLSVGRPRHHHGISECLRTCDLSCTWSHVGIRT